MISHVHLHYAITLTRHIKDVVGFRIDGQSLHIVPFKDIRTVADVDRTAC